MTPADVDYVGLLRRCQRRLRFVAFVRYLFISATMAIGCVEVGLLVAPFQNDSVIVFGVAGLAAAVAGAVVMSVLRAPTLRATAVALDERLRLEDRAVTALQVLAEPDPVARLVVRDAAAHITRLAPASVFPLRAPVGARWMAGGAALIPALVLLNIWAGTPVTLGRVDEGMASGTSSVAQSASARRGGSANRSADATSGAGPVPAPAERASRQAEDVSARRPDSGAPGGSSQDGLPGPSASRYAATARLGESSPAPRDARADQADTAGGSRGDGSGAGGPAGRGEAGAGGLRGGGGRGIGSAVPGMAGGAGGVTGGRLTDLPRVVAPPLAANDRVYAGQYNSAWALAQAAIAQERVPAALRAYVRNYFIAIRPRDTHDR